MQALRLPARRGWSWIQGGFELLKRNPPLLIAVTMTYLLSVLLLNLVPVVGPIVLGVSLPSLSVIVANAFRGVDRFHGMNLDVMRLGIRRNARGLFRLGLVHLGVSLVVIVVGTTLFGVEFAPTGPGEEAMAANMLRLLPMLIIVMLLLWFPPVLVAWHDLPCAKALFFGVVAVLRNLPAFVVYALSVVAIGVLGPFVIMLLLSMLWPAATKWLQPMIATLLLFGFGPVLAASVYVSYRDVFRLPEP